MSTTETRKIVIKRKKNFRRLLLILLLVILALTIISASSVFGLMTGYEKGKTLVSDWEATQDLLSLDEQFQLANDDFNGGRYEIAKQRLEYLLAFDPNYPKAEELLVRTLSILYATATPTPIPPTITPTPTRDLRPIQELFNLGENLVLDGKWTQGIETLISLRQVDPSYMNIQVDGLLYIALRNRGVIKILDENNLEGGIYDLSLAEQFGPLDSKADTVRRWARLYMIGSSFWNAMPQNAVYYFSLLSAEAPYLADSSGWTASQRHYAAIIQWGDHLYKEEDYCGSLDKYSIASSWWSNQSLEATATQSAFMCFTPTPTATITPTITPTFTLTFTPTPTPTPSVTPDLTLTVTITTTETITPGITLTLTITSTITITPSITITTTPTTQVSSNIEGSTPGPTLDISSLAYSIPTPMVNPSPLGSVWELLKYLNSYHRSQ